MPLYRRPGSPYWWIDLRHPRGGRIRRSTDKTDEEVAQRVHDELAARLWTIRETGRQLSDALLEWVKAKPRSQKDLNAVALIRREYPDRPLVDVTAAGVEEALGDRGPGAYNRYMVIVRAAMNIAQRKGWIEVAPHFQRREEPPPDDTHLTWQEWQTLRAELPEHQQAMADFAIATGLRWDNVAMLEWDRVSVARKLAWIPGKEAKGGKGIPVPLSDAALEVLERVEGIDPVWVFTYRGTPIGSPKTAFNKAKARAGLPHAKWHLLRHTWASWHAMNGTPLPVLKALGGWASIDIVVRRYAHLSGSHVAQYANNSARRGRGR